MKSMKKFPTQDGRHMLECRKVQTLDSKTNERTNRIYQQLRDFNKCPESRKPTEVWRQMKPSGGIRSVRAAGKVRGHLLVRPPDKLWAQSRQVN